MVDNEPDYHLYAYDPTLLGASIFCALFALTSAFHVYQLVQNRTWFMIGFLLGGLFEIVGYAARSTSATQKQNEWSMGPYVVQSMCLLVAPSFAAASMYSILGRIIALTNAEAYSIIKKRWITVFFVFSDVFAFLMTAVGGGLMASESATSYGSQIGRHTIVGGLIIQLATYCFFVAVAATFYQRMDALPPVKKQRHSQIHWQHHLRTIFLASSFFILRSIFRIIEYAQGYGGYVFDHEAFLYVFDATPMALAMLYMNWQYPHLSKTRAPGAPRATWYRMVARERSPTAPPTNPPS
ncbi:rta1 domain protein [Botryosphaeria dothidea]|uniref:Rta1 domain protein n=1 Tax=Botryosphaeria dothidea TaxID=55169 RepID=A0A8H4J418_9PEZI|nr:rta1 domain protein [Botryosphaeria dothidea]